MPIRFHFDVISPYAYLAWHQIHTLAASHGRVVEPVPVLLAGLLGHHGTVGPAEIPAKRTYIFKDCLRSAAVLGVPFRPPPAHPFNPLLALRVASLPMPESTRRALIDGLFAAVWADGRGVEDPTVVDEIAAAVGVEAAVERAQEPESKARVKAATERAIRDGVFGVPTMVVDGELFWGCDSLDHLARFLEGRDPIAGQSFEAWESLPVSATRRR